MNLKPPVTVEQLTVEWLEDCPFDETEPAKELARVPRLHAKYLHILTHHRMLAKRHSLMLDAARAFKGKYYGGSLNSKEDATKYKLEPWNAILTRDGVNYHIEADEVVIKLKTLEAEEDEIVEACTNILKEINNRTYQLNSIVKWTAFTKGND